MTEFSYDGVKQKMLVCGGCGVTYSMPLALYNNHRELGSRSKGWTCPNGCSRAFRESETDELRRERDRLKQREAMLEDSLREWQREAESAKASARAYKGAATRLKNRAKAGVCPCCNRTFQNLRRHMASQHPEQDLANVVELGQAK